MADKANRRLGRPHLGVRRRSLQLARQHFSSVFRPLVMVAALVLVAVMSGPFMQSTPDVRAGGTAGGLRDFGQKPVNHIDLLDFDARGCDGAHDVAPAFRAIEAALNRAPDAQRVYGIEGLVIDVPPGVCPIHSTIFLTHPVEIRGAGQGIGPGGATSGGGTYFSTGPDFTSGDIFHVDTPSGRGVTFAHLAFNSGPTRTGGAAIHITGSAGRYTNAHSRIDAVSFLNQYDDVFCEGCASLSITGGTFHTTWVHDALRLAPLAGLETSAYVDHTDFFGDTEDCRTNQNAAIEAHGGYLLVQDSGFIGSKFHVLNQPRLLRSAVLLFQGNFSEEAQVEDVSIAYGGLPWAMVAIQNNEFSALTTGRCIRGHVDVADAGVVSLVSTVSGSKTLANVTSPSLIYQGMPISGEGIPSGTTVTSADAATSVTLSNAATKTADKVAVSHDGPWLTTLDVSHNVVNSFLPSGTAAFQVGGARNGGIENNKANDNGYGGMFASVFGHTAAPFRIADNEATGFGPTTYRLGTIARSVTVIDRSGLPASALPSLTGPADGSCLFVTGAAAPTASSFAQAIKPGSANANAGLLNGKWGYGC